MAKVAWANVGSKIITRLNKLAFLDENTYTPSSGDTITWDGSEWVPDSGTYEPAQLIEEQILASASSGITFSSIPSTFRHLRLEIIGRSAQAATAEGVLIRFNSDSTGGNYFVQRVRGSGGTSSPVAVNTEGGGRCVLVAANNAPAGVAGYGTVDIPFYADTNWQKGWIGLTGLRQGTATTDLLGDYYSGHWLDTSAISTISLVMLTGANWMANSRVALYGIT